MILLGSGCQLPAVPTAKPAPTATPTSFTYGVTVLDTENNPVPNAHVIIEIEGKAPLTEYADDNGYARIVVPTTHAERPGMLRVSADGFEVETQNIDLYQDRLPDTFLMTTRIGVRAPGFCPTDLSFSVDFDGATEDETLVVVSQFATTDGEDPDDITSQIVEEMRDALEPHETIRVEWLNCAILQRNGSETAMNIGRRADIDASIVIWGVYVGTDRESKLNIFFDIVKEKETYLGEGFNQRFGPDSIQPSMFNFIADIGTQTGQMVAFASGLALFNSWKFLAAEPFFDTAIAVAEQQMASEFSIAVRFYRSTNYLHLGRANEAKEDLESILPITTSDSDLYLSTLNNIGGVYSSLGDKQQALGLYNQALPIQRDVGDRAGEATTLNNIGSVYSDLGEKQQALDLYNQALPIQRDVGDRAGEARTINNIGLVYSELGAKQQALDFYNQALSIQREVGDKSGEATTLNNIGLVYSDLGEKQQALDFYNQALLLRREVGDKAGEARTINNIRLVYNALGDKQQALDFYNQALPIQQEVGDKAGEARTINNIGGVYSALGDKQQALDLYNQALPLRREIGDKAGEATTLNNIGSIYSALGDKDQAFNFYNQALPIQREVGNKAGEATTLTNIGGVYWRHGDAQQALDFYNQAFSIQREIGDRASEAATLNNIGRIYWERGDTQQAFDFLNQALFLQQEIGDKWGVNQTRFNIGVAYLAKGDLSKAEEQLSIAFSANESERDPNLNEFQYLLDDVRKQIAEQDGN